MNEDRVQELKELIEKEKGVEITQAEAEEAAANLAGLARLLYDHWVEEQRRKARLEQNPKGFVLDGVGYTCFICGHGTRKDENWYDKWGIKCLICKAAIDRKEIPPSLAGRKDSWYSTYDLERAFNLKGPGLRKWIKTGLIKARTVTAPEGRIHAQLFLIKDNEGFLPPKRLVESRLISFEKDGQIWHRSEPWYRFVDPYDHLKAYTIVEYLSLTSVETLSPVLTLTKS